MKPEAKSAPLEVDGWRLEHRGGTFWEISAPHPNGREGYRMAICDLHASHAVAEHIFDLLLKAGQVCRCGTLLDVGMQCPYCLKTIGG